MHFARSALVIAAMATSLTTLPLRAAEIVLEDARCKDVKPEDLAAVEAKLRAAKAIGADDKIVCKRGSDPRMVERNFSVSDILQWIGGSACREVNSRNREACADKTDEAERTQCNQDEAARYSAAQPACK